MTTFNDGALIRQSVASILNQTHADLELILVDDGSSAATAAILEEFTDPRIRILPQANDGLSSARNRGLHHAKGDYICFLDADDIRAPWSFAEAAGVIAASRPDLLLVPGIYSGRDNRLYPFMDQSSLNGLRAEEALKPTDLAIRKAWAASFEPQCANKFLARSLVERGRLRFPNDHFYEDILFHVLAVAHAGSIEFLDSPGFTYFQRQMRAQLTGSNGQIRFDILGTARVMFQLFEAHPDFSNDRQRGAVAIGALRLLRWCEGELPAYHRYGYRLALRELLRGINPLWLIVDAAAPDPRAERAGLVRYAEEVLG